MKIRKLNLLDIRIMAKILREVKMSKEDFRGIVADVFESATKLSENKDNKDSVSGFVKSLAPAFEGLIDLLAESDSFWEFIASIIGDEQVSSFFTSISKVGVRMTTGE